jgi:hypothetical protein
MTPTVKNLVDDLIILMNDNKKSAIDNADLYVQRGDIDYAQSYIERVRDTNNTSIVYRPHRVRVSTMQAAVEYLIANPPAGFTNISRYTSYQNNGNPDCNIRFAYTDFPALDYFMSPEAAVRCAEKAMVARDYHSEVVADRFQAYDEMKANGMEAYKIAASYALDLKSDPGHDKQVRLKIMALAGQLHRDIQFINLNSSREDLNYLSTTARDLCYATNFYDERGSTMYNAYTSVYDYMNAASAVERAWEQMNEAMDRADEFETKVKEAIR